VILPDEMCRDLDALPSAKSKGVPVVRRAFLQMAGRERSVHIAGKNYLPGYKRKGRPEGRPDEMPVKAD